LWSKIGGPTFEQEKEVFLKKETLNSCNAIKEKTVTKAIPTGVKKKGIKKKYE